MARAAAAPPAGDSASAAAGDPLLKRLQRQLLAYDARRGDKHLVGLASEHLRDDIAGRPCHAKTVFPRCRVGVARVDGKRADVSVTDAAQMRATHRNGRGAEAVLGEDARRRHGMLRRDEGEVEPLRVLAEAGVHARRAKTAGAGNAPVRHPAQTSLERFVVHQIPFLSGAPACYRADAPSEARSAWCRADPSRGIDATPRAP